MGTLIKTKILNIAKLYRFSQTRKIMSSARRMEKVVEQLEKNPYYEKYASKIATLQQTSPEEFLSRIESFKEKEKKLSTKGETGERQYSSLLAPKASLTSSAQNAGDEPLEKIMKVELLENKNSEEIKEIWLQYHSQKDVIAATIPSKDFEEFEKRSKKYPTFLFALPRSQGYEFIMLQFQGHSVHFTPLLCYQVHKENAPECLTIQHYTEYNDAKGIILMRGVFDKNVINVQEAQCLANQLQLYYFQNNPSKTNLLEVFTSTPDKFKHMDLIAQIETLSIS